MTQKQKIGSVLEQILKLSILKYWSQIAAIIVGLFAVFAFVTTTKKTNDDYPQFKEKTQISITNLNLDAKTIMLKLDDIKKNGQGKYSKETTDSIEIIELHKIKE